MSEPLTKYLHDEYGNLVTDEGVNPVYLVRDMDALMKEMRKCLSFYADPQTYGLHGGASDRIMADHGTKAERLLALLPKEQP